MPDLHFALREVREREDKVVAFAVVQGTGTESGAAVRVEIAFVYTFRDGLVARAEEYLDPREALTAAAPEE